MVGRRKCLDRPWLYTKAKNPHVRKAKKRSVSTRTKKTTKVETQVPNDHDDGGTKYMRLSRGLYDQSSKAEKDVPSLLDERGRPMNVKILRPASEPASQETSWKISSDHTAELDSNRIFHFGKTEEFWNAAISGHRTYSPRCHGSLHWDLKGEKQWGLGWIESLQCQLCGYHSPFTKLFTEVDPETKQKGRKPATINRAVQVGLYQCMIGNAALRDVFLALNIPAPSASAMQHQANYVSTVLEDLNERDMATRLQKLKTISPSIMVEGDCRYNNALFSGVGKTPYQPGTQAVYTVSENVTAQKQILQVICKNKHCPVGERLRRKGQEVICPDHTGNCSANLQVQDTIGQEGSWASEAFSKMFETCPDVSFKFFTTDGDSRAFAGLQQVQAEHSTVIPENLRDQRHLTESVRRAIKAANFSPEMFPTPNEETRKKMQGYFAIEVSKRANAEVKACHKFYNGDFSRVKRAMIKVPATIIQCYQGDCDQCNMYSFVCGSDKDTPWEKSYLKIKFTIHPCEDDEAILLENLKIRLGPEALFKTRLNTSTQKSEAFNRTLSRCNPKIVTFKRNFPGRIHSAAHLVNSGIGESTIQKCAAVGAPIRRDSRVGGQLLQGSKRERYIREKMKSIKYKKSRRQRSKKLYKMYFDKMEVVEYRKGLLEMSQGRAEHSYARRLAQSDGEYPSTSGNPSTSGMKTKSRGKKWTRKNKK